DTGVGPQRGSRCRWGRADLANPGVDHTTAHPLQGRLGESRLRDLLSRAEVGENIVANLSHASNPFSQWELLQVCPYIRWEFSGVPPYGDQAKHALQALQAHQGMLVRFKRPPVHDHTILFSG